MSLKWHRLKKKYYSRDTYNNVCLLLFKLVFIVLLWLLFIGFYFLIWNLPQQGAGATDWLTRHVTTANESHYSDYFLLDVARLFMSSICPSTSDCSVFPLDWRRWAGGFWFLSSSSGLLGSCMPGISPCEYWLDNNFLLYSANKLCGCVCVCCFVLLSVRWTRGSENRRDWGCFCVS